MAVFAKWKLVYLPHFINRSYVVFSPDIYMAVLVVYRYVASFMLNFFGKMLLERGSPDPKLCTYGGEK